MNLAKRVDCIYERFRRIRQNGIAFTVIQIQRIIQLIQRGRSTSSEDRCSD